MHSKSSNINNKSLWKKKSFTHQRCSPLQLSSGFPRQRQGGRCSHSQCFPSLAPRQRKTMMDNPLKTRSHYTMAPVSGQLCWDSLPAAFDQSMPLRLGLGSAPLVLVLLPLHSPWPLPALAPCRIGSAEV